MLIYPTRLLIRIAMLAALLSLLLSVPALAQTDSDNDGIPDSVETSQHRTDPFNGDTDGDGLTDAVEIDLGTDPLSPDTDGDSLSDAEEYLQGSNPLVVDSSSESNGFEAGDNAPTTAPPATVAPATQSPASQTGDPLADDPATEQPPEALAFDGGDGPTGSALWILAPIAVMAAGAMGYGAGAVKRQS